MDQLAKIVNRLSEIVGIAAGVMLVVAVLVLNYMIVVRARGIRRTGKSSSASILPVVAATFVCGSPFYALKHAEGKLRHIELCRRRFAEFGAGSTMNISLVPCARGPLPGVGRLHILAEEGAGFWLRA